MKIKLRRAFTYQDGPRNTVTLPPGEHDVDQRVAQLALRWGNAVLVKAKKPAAKKAPENKVGKAAETKAGVGIDPGRRGRPRSKS